MAQITKDTIIMDVLAIDPGTAEFFFEIGMHCLGCPSASGESIEQAAAVHGVDADALVEKRLYDPGRACNYRHDNFGMYKCIFCLSRLERRHNRR